MIDQVPSRTFDRYWIQEWAPNRQHSGPRVGKWIVTIPDADVDSAWATIRVALVDGRLGPSAKCRSALPHPLIPPNGHAVICVYTHDSDDAEDRKRVRDELGRLGFRRIYYKTDEETRRDWRGCFSVSRHQEEVRP